MKSYNQVIKECSHLLVGLMSDRKMSEVATVEAAMTFVIVRVFEDKAPKQIQNDMHANITKILDMLREGKEEAH